MTKWRVVYNDRLTVAPRGRPTEYVEGIARSGPLRDTPAEAQADGRQLGPDVMNLRLQKVELDEPDADVR